MRNLDSNPTGTVAGCNERIGAAHLIGIGGSGMQALAAVLLGRGWRVTGSDLRPESSADLAGCSVRIFAGHAANHVPSDTTLVIYSDAVPPDNVERHTALARKIPLRSYPEMLGELGRGHPTLAIAGTHGKSTVAAMTAAALVAGGLDPLVVFGAAPVRTKKSNPQSSTFPFGGRAGNGPFVVEACEYRANFLRLQPQTAVLLNIEPDHFDCFHSPAELHAAFRAFVERVPGARDVGGDGLVLYNRACHASRRIIRSLHCRTQSFGLDPHADWSAQKLQTRRGRCRFQLAHFGQPLTELTLRIPGRHNVLNAIAAIAAAVEVGVDPQTAATAIAAFPGLTRRLERSAPSAASRSWTTTPITPRPFRQRWRRSARCILAAGCGAFSSRIRPREPPPCWTNWPAVCTMRTGSRWPKSSAPGNQPLSPAT